jgi:copper chaperone CopZ
VATEKHMFRIDGMHCGSCALLIDDTLEELPGVHSARTTMKKGHSAVELDATKSSPDDVIRAIGELGYRASPMP